MQHAKGVRISIKTHQHKTISHEQKDEDDKKCGRRPDDDH